MAGTGQGSPRVATAAVSVALLAALSSTPSSPAPASESVASWTTEIDGGGHQIDAAAAVATDSTGDVFAGGLTDDGTARESDFTVIKADGTSGAVLWQVSIDGPGQGDTLGETVDDIAVDPAGDVVAAGTLVNKGNGEDFAVVKLDGATGRQRWGTRLRGDTTGELAMAAAQALVIDAQGDVYAGGFLDSSVEFKTLVVVKLDGATGAVLWRRQLNGTGALLNDQVNALALDPAGEVIAAGSIGDSSRAEEFFVAKLDQQTGSVVWRSQLSGRAADPSNRQDEAYDVAVDSAGDVLAAGALDNGGRTRQDMAVVKLAGDTGNVLWSRSIDGAAHAFDLASAVAVDSRNDVLVGGFRHNQDEFRPDFSVGKLSGADGRVRWLRDLFGGEVRALTVDAAGRAVAVGEVGDDLTVAEFGAATGRLVRTVRLDGSEHSFDYGFDVATGDDGRIVAVGSVINTGASSDFTILQRRTR